MQAVEQRGLVIFIWSVNTVVYVSSENTDAAHETTRTTTHRTRKLCSSFMRRDRSALGTLDRDDAVAAVLAVEIATARWPRLGRISGTR